jgi:release factor glutamine methyltransferase
MTVRTLLHQAQQALMHTSSTPRLDADILMMHCLKQPRGFLYHHDHLTLTTAQRTAFTSYLKRRLSGEPIAYITGEKEFWSRRFIVTPQTLIPRPETEHLVEWALNRLPGNQSLHIAELGTGCGAIAITLSLEQPKWHINATEYSQAALTIARKNAQALGAEHIFFYHNPHCDHWCCPLPQNIKFSAIISNPPYLSLDDTDIQQNVLHYEPVSALLAKNNGLAALTAIIREAKDYLTADGYLALEHGHQQAANVQKIMHHYGYQAIQTYRDLCHHDRLTVGVQHV